jgi:hypothetical protein
MSFSVSAMSDGIEVFRVQKETECVLNKIHKSLNDCDLRIKVSKSAIESTYLKDKQVLKMAGIYAGEIVATTCLAMSAGPKDFADISIFIVVQALFSLGVGAYLNDRIDIIRAINIPKWEGVKSIADEKFELELNLKRFQALIEANEGRDDDIVAHIGRKLFQL